MFKFSFRHCTTSCYIFMSMNLFQVEKFMIFYWLFYNFVAGAKLFSLDNLASRDLTIICLFQANF